MRNKSINIVTLGCSKNTVDSEVLMAQLLASGIACVHNSDDMTHKVVVLNTCGFIGDAKEESIDTIMECVEQKEEGNIEKIVVFGCLSQRYKDELTAEIPEVDAFFGVDDLAEIVEYLGGAYDESLIVKREVTTPSHYAYVKIAEGCNWGCSYCAIPLIRGRHKSRKMEDIVSEVEILALRGVKEILLIAQDLTYYGKELYGERKLAQLLEKLCKIEGIEWIRLHYAYPTAFPLEVIEVMKREPKVCKYIDIPLQHVSDRILKSMKRGLSMEESISLMEKFRSEVPEIAIRTTFIAGYPGETDEEFEELIDFVKKSKFERMGCFAYSEEEGTAAANLEDDVTPEVKEARVERIMRIQEEIALQNNLKFVSTEQKVIIDRCEGDYFVGRMEFDSPEVDNEVLVESAKPLVIGGFYQVEILRAENYDLIAKAIIL